MKELKIVVQFTVDSMKGVSLPINTVVLLVLAIIVVAGVVLFFTGILTEGREKMRDDQIKVECCAVADCKYEKSFADWIRECGVTADDIQRVFGTTKKEEIWEKYCGCPPAPSK